MNLAAYLQMRVKTLDEHTPSCQKRQKKAQKIKYDRNCENANITKREKALTRYARAMQGEWTGTAVIESRLGVSRASCTPTLTHWLSLGLVERRKPGPPDKWNRRKGYEWRMVSPASSKG